MRKVDHGKLAKILNRCLVICSRCFYDLIFGKETDEDVFLIDINLNSPLIVLLEPRNTLEATGIVRAYPSILTILGIGRWSKILASIIESVVIYVIRPKRYFYTENFARHRDSIDLSIHLLAANGIERFGVIAPFRRPVPFGDEWKIYDINEANLSICKGDFAVGFKEWERHTGIASCIGLGRVLDTPDASILSA